MNKIAVVTAITSNKDTLKKQPFFKGVDYIAFLDKKIADPQWETRQAFSKFKDPVLNAKIHKILTHKYVTNPYILWLDGNLVLKQNPLELVKLMGKKSFAFFKHHSRRCLYDEIAACLKVKRGHPRELVAQKEAYLAMGFPKKAGMCECPAFIRKNNPKANSAFEKWWAEILRYSSRDQVSFPVAFQGLKWETIPGNVFGDNAFFEYHKHNGQ